MTNPLLRLTNITKNFGAVQALKGVSFELQSGEVHALLGENGAGKSTLIKVMTGAHQPDNGTLEIEGLRVLKFDPGAARKLGVACIYQQLALFPDLTVAENIALRLESARGAGRFKWAQNREMARQLLARMGAVLSPDAEVRELSMPEQQLVEIACALGGNARILIMDEPTAALTRKEQQILFRVIRELRADGVGIVYISHRLEEIFELADRVTVLRDGRSLSTNRVEAITEAALIKSMVGREVTDLYPAGEGPARGEIVVCLKNFGCSASGIHGVDLEVRTGEVVGLAGLVGSGRTELAHAIFGITPADNGELLLNGKAVLIRSPRAAIAHGIAYVPEDRRRHGIILEMAVAANITMATHDRIFPKGWLRFESERQVALKAIQELDIQTPGPESPGASLSGGNQQKVVLARWLATNPKLLILDEPTQGVDVGAKSEIYGIIRHLAKEGLAVLLISSDLSEILGMSDHIAVMRDRTICARFPGKADGHEVMAAALGHSKP